MPFVHWRNHHSIIGYKSFPKEPQIHALSSQCTYVPKTTNAEISRTSLGYKTRLKIGEDDRSGRGTLSSKKCDTGAPKCKKRKLRSNGPARRDFMETVNSGNRGDENVGARHWP